MEALVGSGLELATLSLASTESGHPAPQTSTFGAPHTTAAGPHTPALLLSTSGAGSGARGCFSICSRNCRCSCCCRSFRWYVASLSRAQGVGILHEQSKRQVTESVRKPQLPRRRTYQLAASGGRNGSTLRHRGGRRGRGGNLGPYREPPALSPGSTMWGSSRWLGLQGEVTFCGFGDPGALFSRQLLYLACSTDGSKSCLFALVKSTS